MTLRGDCPICGRASSEDFLHRSGVPLLQNCVLPDPETARGVERGDLVLAACEECGFVFNRAYDAGRLVYCSDYDNTQTCSGAFNAHFAGLARRLVEERGVRDCRIVEVGCGQGGFLRALVEAEGSGNRGWGFDPAYRGPESDLDGRLRFEQCYYGPDTSDVPADVVLCRHVIEHVPDPMSLLRSIRAALSGSTAPKLMLETPDVGWILEHGVVWDFFYEHCSYFSPQSMKWALEAAGFCADSIEHVFGEQYLWAEAISASERGSCPEPPPCEGEASAVDRGCPPEPSPYEGEGRVGVRPERRSIVEMARRFGRKDIQRTQRWRAILEDRSQLGGTAVWGAGAKGVTFANLIDPDRELIECVVDLNPNKQGKFLPGTGHPIVAPGELARLRVRSALVLNPNYVSEVAALVGSGGMEVEAIDAMQGDWL